jgi:2-amino-4-hydroxy-6-hydroxymethyldihydropteridine diphosphokinase/dihydropteroate synthase
MAADSLKRVAIALGSNLGDRPGNLREALRRLGALPHVSVQATSRLYESSPMYVTDQPAFLNAAAEVRTTLPPLDLLRVLKDVERDMGRGFGGDQIRWGPRPIDLDIVFYEDETVMHAETDTTRELVVPHPRWQERDFVKGPLSDLTGSWALTASAVVSPTGLDRNLVASKRLWMEQGGERGLRMASKDGSLGCVLPIGGGATWQWSQRTSVMGILNVTPDSFSDGGSFRHVDDAIKQAMRMVRDGADVLDVGGQSTRPGAELLSPAEEWERVGPVLDAIRQEGIQIPVSIDTFHAEVAAKAVAAGANIVNDVSGGTLDPKMHATVADAGVSYVLMHMRGTPQTMQSASNVAYDDVCRDVAQSLQALCDQAVRAGIESWRIILDPGIGFAKTSEGSTELVANLPAFRSHISEPYKALPVLLGASRKKFLGQMIGRPEEEAAGRDWASCAINAIGALHGANIIRTHNVRATKDATLVADAVIDRARGWL